MSHSSRSLRALCLALLPLAAHVTTGCEPFVGPVAAAGTLHTPVGIAVHPSGRWVYVASTNFEGEYRVEDGGAIDVIDAESLAIVPGATVRVPSYGGRLAFGGVPSAPDTLYLAARATDAVIALTLSDDGGALSCQGGADVAPCTIGELPGDPYDVTEVRFDAEADRRTLAVASLSGAVTLADVRADRFDESALRSRALMNGTNTLVPLPGFDELLAAGRFSNTLVALTWYRGADGDVAAVVPLRSMNIASPTGSSEIRDVVVSTDQRYAWVTSARPGGVQRFDISRDADGRVRGRFEARHDLDGAPADTELLVENGQPVLYVTLPDRDAIAVIHAMSGARLDTIHVGGLPFGMAADRAAHRRLYVTLFEDDAVAVIDVDPASPSFRRVIGRVAPEAR